MDKEKELKINKAAELCENCRLQKLHCSESSIRGVAEALGITLSEEMLRVSSGFRGGGGGYGGRCGVVEAGIMLISQKYGRTDPKACVCGYSYLIRLLQDRFYEELGGIDCRVLRPFAYYLSGKEQNCSYVYKNGAKIVAQILLEADELIANMPEEEKYGYKKEKVEKLEKIVDYPCK